MFQATVLVNFSRVNTSVTVYGNFPAVRSLNRPFRYDGVHALVDGEFVTMRIPYPLGFYSKGFEGRIDDPDAGWKGRGLWVPSGDRTPWPMEGGQGTRPLVVHFQVRPDTLAK